MEFIFIIIGIVVFISSITKKAKQEEARRAAAERAAAQRRAEMGQAGPVSQEGMSPNRQFPSASGQYPGYPARPAAPVYAPARQPAAAAPAPANSRFPNEFEGSSRSSTEGTGVEAREVTWGSLQGTAEEAKIKIRDPQVTAKVSYKSSMHAVRATSEGGHAHQESSMTGEEECPPEEYRATSAHAVNVGSFRLEFAAPSVKQGVLYSEILGKPRALRR